jgi:hypothetical protein
VPAKKAARCVAAIKRQRLAEPAERYSSAVCGFAEGGVSRKVMRDVLPFDIIPEAVQPPEGYFSCAARLKNDQQAKAGNIEQHFAQLYFKSIRRKNERS